MVEIGSKSELFFSSQIRSEGNFFLLNKLLRFVHDESLELVADFLGFEITCLFFPRKVELFSIIYEVGSFHICFFLFLCKNELTFILVAVFEHEVEEFDITVDNALLFGGNHGGVVVSIDKKRFNLIELD